MTYEKCRSFHAFNCDFTGIHFLQTDNSLRFNQTYIGYHFTSAKKGFYYSEGYFFYNLDIIGHN